MSNEEIFNKNITIAYKIANKYKINHMQEYEDIKQIALIGLWKAVCKWDKIRPLSTWAYPIIYNEINYYLRSLQKENKKQLISMEKPIYEDNLVIADVLVDEFDLEYEILNKIEKEEINSILNEELNKIKENNRLIYLELAKGKKQHEIAKQFNVSQVAVSRVQKRLINKVKLRYTKEVQKCKENNCKML